MINARRFVQGVDEPVWVEVLNRAYRDREDWRAITAEEMLLDEKRPSFDAEGRFITELGGKPIGVVHANVDRFREDRKGFIRLGVAPESCGGEIEQQLLETALSELKARGMTVAQTEVESEKRERTQLLEGLGFELVRVFSFMDTDLANIPQGIGENKHVAISLVRKDVEEDIELFNRLDNASFREHFNFRPDTVEETRHHMLSNPYFKEQEIFFAALDGESIGYIGVGIDEKYSLEKKVKAGEIFTIGVLKHHRRTGIGARLMLHGLETLKAKGMTKAILGVDDSNPTKAMRLYERAGFRVKKKFSIFEREL